MVPQFYISDYLKEIVTQNNTTSKTERTDEEELKQKYRLRTQTLLF